MNRTLLFFVALALLFGGGMVVYFAVQRQAPPLAGGGNADAHLDPNRKLETFRLTTSREELFDSSALRGKVWVANFFFSRCPTVCLKLNQRVRELEREFGPRGVEFVSISVDPEFDSPTVLNRYAQSLEANVERWHFLTGQFQYVQRVATDIFQARVEGVQHDETLMLMDAEHKLRGYFHFSDPHQVAILKQEIEKLLAASAASPNQAAPAESEKTPATAQPTP